MTLFLHFFLVETILIFVKFASSAYTLLFYLEVQVIGRLRS